MAVVITPAPGKSYADILSAICQTIVPDDAGMDIWQVQKTAFGRVLIELGQFQRLAKFLDDLRNALSQLGVNIKSLPPCTRLEALDLNVCATKSLCNKVLAAVAKELNVTSAGVGAKISILPPNYQEFKVAVIEIDEAITKKLSASND